MWVAKELLGYEDTSERLKLLGLFVDTAHYCAELGNFDTTFALVAGLNSTPIYRLK